MVDTFAWISLVDFGDDLTKLDFVHNRYMVRGYAQKLEAVINQPDFRVPDVGLDLTLPEGVGSNIAGLKNHTSVPTRRHPGALNEFSRLNYTLVIEFDQVDLHARALANNPEADDSYNNDPGSGTYSDLDTGVPGGMVLTKGNGWDRTENFINSYYLSGTDKSQLFTLQTGSDYTPVNATFTFDYESSCFVRPLSSPEYANSPGPYQKGKSAPTPGYDRNLADRFIGFVDSEGNPYYIFNDGGTGGSQYFLWEMVANQPYVFIASGDGLPPGPQGETIPGIAPWKEWFADTPGAGSLFGNSSDPGWWYNQNGGTFANPGMADPNPYRSAMFAAGDTDIGLVTMTSGGPPFALDQFGEHSCFPIHSDYYATIRGPYITSTTFTGYNDDGVKVSGRFLPDTVYAPQYNLEPLKGTPYVINGRNRVAINVAGDHLAMAVNGGEYQVIQKEQGFNRASHVTEGPDPDNPDITVKYLKPFDGDNGFVFNFEASMIVRCVWLYRKRKSDKLLPRLSRIRDLPEADDPNWKTG